jgi:hypothetical protein
VHCVQHQPQLAIEDRADPVFIAFRNAQTSMASGGGTNTPTATGFFQLTPDPALCQCAREFYTRPHLKPLAANNGVLPFSSNVRPHDGGSQL